MRHFLFTFGLILSMASVSWAEGRVLCGTGYHGRIDEATKAATESLEQQMAEYQSMLESKKIIPTDGEQIALSTPTTVVHQMGIYLAVVVCVTANTVK